MVKSRPLVVFEYVGAVGCLDLDDYGNYSTSAQSTHLRACEKPVTP